MSNQGNSHTKFPESHSQHMKIMQECMSVCVACAKKCLNEGHKKTAALCAECSDICALAIKAASGHFESENAIMELCSEMCRKCSDECKKMEAEHCKECAEVCKRCAEMCAGTHSMR